MLFSILSAFPSRHTANAQLPSIPLFTTPLATTAGGPTNPGTVAGLVIWTDITNACTNVSGSTPANNGVVNGWGDQSANHYTLVAHNSTWPVYLTAGGPSGGPCITFSNNLSGTGALTNRAGAGSYAQPNVFFFVMNKHDPVNTGGAILNSYSGQDEQINFIQPSALHFYAGTDVGGTAVNFPSETWFIMTVVFNGSSSVVRTNGVQALAMSSVGSGAFPGVTLGNFFNYSSAAWSKFTAFIWYNGATATGTAQMHGIEQWLGQEFGITVF